MSQKDNVMDTTTSNDDTATEVSSDEVPFCKEIVHKCTIAGCKARFSKKSKLEYHLRRHTGERPFKCDEPNCSKTYLYAFHLRRHKDVRHKCTTSERIPCTYLSCQLLLANKYSLKKHLVRKHNLERQYRFNCSQCTHGFCKKRQLLKHMYEHTGDLPFACDLCSARFLTHHSCNRHKRTHTKYTCDCKEQFERWSDLLKHKKSCETQVKKYQCKVCQKSIKSRSQLTVHMRKCHAPRKDRESFVCGYENCGRSYTYKKNLTFHINFYHKKVALPQISCTFPGCVASFSQMQKLQLHIKKVHNKSSDHKISRRPRKDIGKPRECMASLLSGLTLPLKMHKAVVDGQKVIKDGFVLQHPTKQLEYGDVHSNIIPPNGVDESELVNEEGLRNLVSETLSLIGMPASSLNE